jgi:predicted DNA-binding antitoxin AbrB/MazE fold protein
MGGNITNSLNTFRTMISNIRTFFESIASNIMGIFLNLIIEFQKITIGIRDLIGKLIGVVVTIMYIMDGSIKTMESAWNGPTGQMVRFISGNCFHPDTKVKLKDGSIVKMKDLHLGDSLENGSMVNILMKIIKTKNDKLYKIKNGVDRENIYVTGTHMVKYNDSYVMVKDYPHASEQNEIDCEYFSCIITDDHMIQLGSHLFYDWDDDDIRLKSFSNIMKK